MNKTNISREIIIDVSTDLLKNSDTIDLNMRSVAHKCGVAVGSIYNYFPTKSELVIAVIEDVWRKVFHSKLFITVPNQSFTEFVSEMYKQVYIAQKDYHNFFLSHHTLIDSSNKTHGKSTMAQYIGYIKAALLDKLTADHNINHSIWTSDFTTQKFANFIFENLLFLLSKGESNCDFLVLTMEHILY